MSKLNHDDWNDIVKALKKDYSFTMATLNGCYAHFYLSMKNSKTVYMIFSDEMTGETLSVDDRKLNLLKHILQTPGFRQEFKDLIQSVMNMMPQMPQYSVTVLSQLGLDEQDEVKVMADTLGDTDVQGVHSMVQLGDGIMAAALNENANKDYMVISLMIPKALARQADVDAYRIKVTNAVGSLAQFLLSNEG